MARYEEVPIAELVLDFSLYPRHQVDDTNVRSLGQAFDAGVVLPPVVADRKTKRVVDGLHRIRMLMRKGVKTVRVEWKDYEDEAAVLEDAIRLNMHGRQLAPYDKSRCIQLAEGCSMVVERLAAALHMTVEAVEELKLRKTAVGPDEEMVPIKATLSDFAGQSLSRRQILGNVKAGGMMPLAYVNQVLNLLESNLVDRKNLRLMAGLQNLHQALGRFLGERRGKRKSA